MTVPAVYDFASIRQYHDEIVERKQAALAESAAEPVEEPIPVESRYARYWSGMPVAISSDVG